MGFQVAYVPIGVGTFHLESAQIEFEKSIDRSPEYYVCKCGVCGRGAETLLLSDRSLDAERAGN